ncbi:hypothetical protein [Actinoplanes sp. NBRC 103695]|uniref:hypothetical protein n=1 Tax=Actinoplanes sp. NBRC 103695 TaxID=3032202 RepID=UPI0024A47557|nr:hypothetical protein [Actinoplanes sp. NBRC 103695]GLY97146.1 hypothetical protein Acsp02_44000 [Actinoplanes sp. NBRC 103695]
MPDVLDVLRNLPRAVEPGRTDAEAVAADVARGHRAVADRRRRRFAVAGGAAAAIVAGAAFALPVGGAGPQSPKPPGPPVSAASRVQLVGWTGKQPVGFEVSTVPSGWEVVSSDKSAFVVAPPGQEITQKPGDPISFEGRIVVSLQGLSHFPDESPITEVDINGRKGRMGFPLADEGKLSDTRWLFFKDAKGRNVEVDVPASAGLSDDQIVSFAEGVTVTDQAQEIGG